MLHITAILASFLSKAGIMSPSFGLFFLGLVATPYDSHKEKKLIIITAWNFS